MLLGRRGLASATEEATLHGMWNLPIGMGRGVIRGLGFRRRVRGPQTPAQWAGYGMTYPGVRFARWAAPRAGRLAARGAGLGLGRGIGVGAYGAGLAAGMGVGALRFGTQAAGFAAGVGYGAYRAASRVLTPAGMIWGAVGIGTAAMIGGGVLRAELSSWAPVNMRRSAAGARFQNSTYGLPQALSELARPY